MNCDRNLQEIVDCNKTNECKHRVIIKYQETLYAFASAFEFPGNKTICGKTLGEYKIRRKNE